MKKNSKRIPISAAKEIGNKYDKDQVILVTFNKKIGDTWVTTWGRTVDECAQAAEGGNFVKEALGWPNELTEDKATRQRKQKTKIRNKIVEEIREKLEKADKTHIFGLNHYEVRDVNKVLDEMLTVPVKAVV